MQVFTGILGLPTNCTLFFFLLQKSLTQRNRKMSKPSPASLKAGEGSFVLCLLWTPVSDMSILWNPFSSVLSALVL